MKTPRSLIVIFMAVCGLATLAGCQAASTTTPTSTTTPSLASQIETGINAASATFTAAGAANPGTSTGTILTEIGSGLGVLGASAAAIYAIIQGHASAVGAAIAANTPATSSTTTTTTPTAPTATPAAPAVSVTTTAKPATA